MMTCVIESSVSPIGEPFPAVAGQPILPPKERTINSKIGRDVSRERKKVYGAKRFVDIDCGNDVIDRSVRREFVEFGSDAEG